MLKNLISRLSGHVKVKLTGFGTRVESTFQTELNVCMKEMSM